MKYAIVESGGKQYKAVEGGMIEVDKLPLEIGKKVDLEDVLLVSDGKVINVGTPKVSGAVVKATVVDQFKAPKVIVFKYRPRQRYRVKQGHRQQYTRLQIDTIQLKGKSKAEETKEEKPKADKAAPKKETAAKKPAAKTAKKAPTNKAATKKTTEKSK
jgi:large subunit ribosomal protein L21